jgi:8-oxo-dGTP diphosphatase
MNYDNYRRTISEIVGRVDPLDDLERDHIEDVLAWIDSGAPLCRVTSPDSPPKHLVSYFLVVDPERRRALLVDHVKAGLWLPTGGHVEPGEHPEETVRREMLEELRLDAELLASDPLFVTVTTTVGSTAGHTDVSLWYVVRGDASSVPWFDHAECTRVAWFDVDALPLDRADPHLGRFASKLRGVLTTFATT